MEREEALKEKLRATSGTVKKAAATLKKAYTELDELAKGGAAAMFEDPSSPKHEMLPLVVRHLHALETVQKRTQETEMYLREFENRLVIPLLAGDMERDISAMITMAQDGKKLIERVRGDSDITQHDRNGLDHAEAHFNAADPLLNEARAQFPGAPRSR